MDIFFLVTTTVVALVGVLLVAILVYVMRIVRDVSEITDMVKKEARDLAKGIGAVTEEVREGVQDMREHVEDGIKTAKTYTKAIAGTGIVKAVSQLLEAFAEEREATTKRSRKKKSE